MAKSARAIVFGESDGLLSANAISIVRCLPPDAMATESTRYGTSRGTLRSDSAWAMRRAFLPVRLLTSARTRAIQAANADAPLNAVSSHLSTVFEGSAWMLPNANLQVRANS